MPDEVLSRLTKLGKNTDKISEKMLIAGGKVILKETKSSLTSVVGNSTKIMSRSTGELKNSLGLSPVDVDGNGISNIKVGFNEPRKAQYKAKNKRSYYEITNAMIANVIEYGRKGQPPKPFLAKAKRKSKKTCIETMQKVFEEEVSKI